MWWTEKARHGTARLRARLRHAWLRVEIHLRRTKLSSAPETVNIELTGKEKVADREAYVLVVKGKTGPPIKQYFDAKVDRIGFDPARLKNKDS